jgi:hypothetical protein
MVLRDKTKELVKLGLILDYQFGIEDYCRAFGDHGHLEIGVSWCGFFIFKRNVLKKGGQESWQKER